MMKRSLGIGRIVLATAALAGIVVCGIGCSRKADGKAPQQQASSEKINVALASTRLEPVQRTVAVFGTLYGDEETTISSKVAGRIARIHHDIGDRVAPGTPLAQVDQTDYELTVAQKELAMQETLTKLGLQSLPASGFDPAQVPTVVRAQRQAANAEAKLNRARQLFQQQPPLMSEQDFADLQTAFDVAKSDYDVALLNARSLLAEARTRQSDLASARQMLADATVRAPGDVASVAAPTTQALNDRYAVVTRLVSVGEYMREGTPMFRLVADNPIKFRAAVPERYIAQVKTGQTAHVLVEAYKEHFTGKVARINPQVDPLSRMFQIEVLVNNDPGLLRSGAFARGSVLTYTEPDVTFVPQEAIVSFAGVKKVFTVRDGKAVEAIIETGVHKDGYVEVTKGLSGIHQVAVKGINRLAGGTPVQVKASS